MRVPSSVRQGVPKYNLILTFLIAFCMKNAKKEDKEGKKIEKGIERKKWIDHSYMSEVQNSK